jgi:hypothetical protein
MTDHPRVHGSVILQKNDPAQLKMVEHYSLVENG